MHISKEMKEMLKKEVYEAFDGKTVLVTGGAGAIGSNLVKTLNELENKENHNP